MADGLLWDNLCLRCTVRMSVEEPGGSSASCAWLGEKVARICITAVCSSTGGFVSIGSVSCASLLQFVCVSSIVYIRGPQVNRKYGTFFQEANWRISARMRLGHNKGRETSRARAVQPLRVRETA